MPELTSSKDVSWSKVIWSVLIIVVVVGLISGALFWYFVVRQPTESTPSATNVATSSSKTATSSAKPDETADWKVYNDSYLNFQIKYPKDWFIQPADDKNSTTILTNYAMPSTGSDFNPVLDKGKYKVDFGVSTKDKTTSLESYAQDPMRTTPDDKLKSKTSLLIDGHEAFYIEWENQSQSGYGFAAVFVEKGPSTVFTISAGNDYTGFKTTFNLILSTFKFL